jgi:hypothetical protein
MSTWVEGDLGRRRSRKGLICGEDEPVATVIEGFAGLSCLSCVVWVGSASAHELHESMEQPARCRAQSGRFSAHLS